MKSIYIYIYIYIILKSNANHIKMYFWGIPGPDPAEISENKAPYAEFHREFDFLGPGGHIIC